MSFLGPGRPLSSQTKEIVLNVYRYFSEQYLSDYTIMTVIEQVSLATGVSGSCIQRIARDNKKRGREYAVRPPVKTVRRKGKTLKSNGKVKAKDETSANKKSTKLSVENDEVNVNGLFKPVNIKQETLNDCCSKSETDKTRLNNIKVETNND